MSGQDPRAPEAGSPGEPSPFALGAIAVVASAATIWALARIDVGRGSDFVALYAAVAGVLRGVGLYDEAGQTALLAALTGQEWKPLPPFVYPPWFAALWLPLGLLDRGSAYAVFLVANLWFAVGTLGWLARPLARLPRLVVLLSAALYVPLVAVLGIGQFVLPVLAGCAAAAVALDRRSPGWFAVAVVALSLKPHLGAVVGLAALAGAGGAGLRGRFVAAGAAAVVAAGAVGFAIAPSWPTGWLASLARFEVYLGGACDTCVSLPYLATGGRGGAALAAGAAVALVLAGAARVGRARLAEPERWVGFAVAATPLVLPYARNYDLALLVFPLTVLARRPAGAAVAAACWLAAAATLVLPRGAGAHLWWVSAAACALTLLLEPERDRVDPG